MNVEVLVRNTTKEAFSLGMRLIALDAVAHNAQFKCDGYKIINNELFLSWYSKDCVKLPYEFDLQQTIDFAWGWYEANKKPILPRPDTDGSTKVAFELSTQRTGVGSQDWGMFCSVKPIWFIAGK